jgi:hypothetical protein
MTTTHQAQNRRLNETMIPRRWMPAVIDLIGDEVARYPAVTQRIVACRAHELHKRGYGDTAFRPDDDPSVVMLRAISQVAPAITEAVLDAIGEQS